MCYSQDVKYFNSDTDKSEKLYQERHISFEEVVFYIEQGQLLDVLEHPNQKKYPDQKMFVVEIENYV